MIIGKEPNYFDAAAFIKGLQQAALGVTRISVQNIGSGPGTYSTGWLITDDLVVTIGYSYRGIDISPQESRISCLFLDEHNENFEIEADLVSGLTSQALDSALLRLRKPLPNRALRLEGASIRQGEPLFVVQYPLGNPQLKFSIGRLFSSEASWLRYDADTQPGSSGSPILSSNWLVAGMHHASKLDVNQTMNEGLSIAKILEGLRGSSAWEEIARYHNLADITAARQSLEQSKGVTPPPPTENDLLSAAVRWSFDPKRYPVKIKNRLKLLVSNPSAQRWSLRASERQRLLRSAGSLEALRKARGREVIDEPGQRVIDRILEGPPYSLAKVEEADLPYWLQATRWFAEVAPKLPTPAEVNCTLEKRRVRGQFASIAGASFRGRARELSQLQKWYANDQAGPMVITGIGGVGKSALVARFAIRLPEEPLLLWLDFDRADLAPDDAISVLTMLYQQAAVQLEGFALPTLDASNWKKEAEKFGEALSAALGSDPAPLLVLDGFEVAQHVKQHQEIWGLLELVLMKAPRLRVVVSGRAPVKGLKLNRRLAHQIHLTGMARTDAKKWLQEHGIKKAKVLESVLDIAHGVPLVLKLAVRWVDAGGEVDELPEELPEELVQGFLYQRILDRVLDPLLKPVVRDALVLRYLTEEMLQAILADSLPKELTRPEVFARLELEMGIVGSDDANPTALSMTLSEKPGVLAIRPEVRSATLMLLEKSDLKRVRTIDERAVAWYGERDLNDVANAAELVYHSLRLGKVEKAESVWRDDCAPLLIYAEDDLPATPPTIRSWLRNKGVGTTIARATLENWEKDAEKRIRAAISRGLMRAAPEILAERRERSAESPLILYDAWTHWSDGHPERARAALDKAKPAGGAIGRDRAILGAMLAAKAGERKVAYQTLDLAEDKGLWSDRPDGERERLAIAAARVHLAVDLTTELKLLGIPDTESTSDNIFQQLLAPTDVVLPKLRQRVEQVMPIEIAFSISMIEIPVIETDLNSFARQLNDARMIPFVLPLEMKVSTKDQEPWDVDEILHLKPVLPQFIQEPFSEVGRLAIDLAILSWHRWRMATMSLFLTRACDLANSREPIDVLSLAIIGSLAAFTGMQLQFFDKDRNISGSVDELLRSVLSKRNIVSGPVVTPDRLSLAKEIIYHEKRDLPEEQLQQWLYETQVGSNIPFDTERREFFPKFFFRSQDNADLLAVLLFHLGPDPLETLCRRLVGLPDSSGFARQSQM